MIELKVYLTESEIEIVKLILQDGIDSDADVETALINGILKQIVNSEKVVK